MPKSRDAYRACSFDKRPALFSRMEHIQSKENLENHLNNRRHIQWHNLERLGSITAKNLPTEPQQGQEVGTRKQNE